MIRIDEFTWYGEGTPTVTENVRLGSRYINKTQGEQWHLTPDGWSRDTGSVESSSGVMSEDFEAVPGVLVYPVNTASQAITLTLPAAPPTGTHFEVVDARFTWGDNNVTVNGNGANLNGQGSDFVHDLTGGRMLIVYLGDSLGWSITI